MKFQEYSFLSDVCLNRVTHPEEKGSEFLRIVEIFATTEFRVQNDGHAWRNYSAAVSYFFVLFDVICGGNEEHQYGNRCKEIQSNSLLLYVENLQWSENKKDARIFFFSFLSHIFQSVLSQTWLLSPSIYTSLCLPVRNILVLWTLRNYNSPKIGTCIQKLNYLTSKKTNLIPEV